MMCLLIQGIKFCGKKSKSIYKIKNSTKILKLKQINEKLQKEIKSLGTNLGKSIEKSRVKNKSPNPLDDANSKGKIISLNNPCNS